MIAARSSQFLQLIPFILMVTLPCQLTVGENYDVNWFDDFNSPQDVPEIKLESEEVSLTQDVYKFDLDSVQDVETLWLYEYCNPPSYLDFINRRPYRPFHKQHIYTTLEEVPKLGLCGHEESIGGQRKFGIFLNDNILEQIPNSIWQYVDDLESSGWLVVLYTTEGGTSPDPIQELEAAQELKDLIKQEYEQGMVGCILIGEFPIAWYEDEAGSGEGWVIELYYRDMDCEWLDVDGNGLFDQIIPGEGDLAPEIWTSRLYVESLQVDDAEKVALLENYFRKNHAYREGTLTLPKRGLDYAEDDFADRETMLNYLYNDVTLVDDNQQTSAIDYLQRLTEGYELVRLWAHGWGYGHGHPNKPCKAIAYAHCYVHSPVFQEVQLRLGSDDGIKVWLNGTNIYTNDVYRVHQFEQDILDIFLNEGWNGLLVKISDKYGGWQFSARFSNSLGQDIANLSYWIDDVKPQQTPPPRSGYIREWLINGWYKNPDDETRLSEDYLGGEHIVEPSEGEVDGANEWIAHHSSEDYVDLENLFKVERTWVNYNHIIDTDPCCFFYDIFSCGTYCWWDNNYIDGWYIFTDSYGLASWGLLRGVGRIPFYEPLGEGKCLGEAQFAYLNSLITDNIPRYPAEFGMFGDPTLAPGPRPPRIIYVDDDGSNDPSPGDPNVSDPLENGSEEHPFDSIQEAIDEVASRDTIIVLEGIYKGNGNCAIDFHGKAITLRSMNPRDPNVVAATVVDCNATYEEHRRAFFFWHGEQEDSTLSGFTITNGLTNHGGAIRIDNSSPTITCCIFSGNQAMGEGGAITILESTSPIFENCTFSGNSARNGGAVHNSAGCSPIYKNCTFSGNLARRNGGAIYNSTSCSPIFENCIFFGNSAINGGGIHSITNSAPIIANCTFSRNSGQNNGGGMYVDSSAETMLSNCIFWDNIGQSAPELYVKTSLNISYTDIMRGQGGVSLGPDAVLSWGNGNINIDPLFADPDKGDYHLKSQAGRWNPSNIGRRRTTLGTGWVIDDVTSPCIDAGDPNSFIAFEPQPNGDRINMGAYGGTIKASQSP